MVDVAKEIHPENKASSENVSLSRIITVHCVKETNSDSLIWLNCCIFIGSYITLVVRYSSVWFL
jgi:hypothetical protein